MIPEAREVRLKPKIRKVLEARCRAPSTPQRDVRRARIVLLAAEGRSTRSIAEDVGVQPRIVIAAHSKRRRRVEVLGFMNSVVAAFPDREMHVILDNLNTHKKNERWLKTHPKVHFHFIPTRSSWLNQVETWFSILQGQSLSGASFTDIKQ